MPVNCKEVISDLEKKSLVKLEQAIDENFSGFDKPRGDLIDTSSEQYKRYIGSTFDLMNWLVGRQGSDDLEIRKQALRRFSEKSHQVFLKFINRPLIPEGELLPTTEFANNANMEMFQLLVELGARVSPTPLDVVISGHLHDSKNRPNFDHSKYIAFVKDPLMKPYLEARNSYDPKTPLQYAIACGDAVLVSALLEAGADVNATYQKKDGAVHKTTLQNAFELDPVRKVNPAIVSALMKANPNDAQHLTPVERCILTGDLNALSQALQEKTELDVTSKHLGFSPLQLALLLGYDQMAKMLVERGANPRHCAYQTPEPISLAQQDPELFKFLEGKIVERESKGSAAPVVNATTVPKGDESKVNPAPVGNGTTTPKEGESKGKSGFLGMGSTGGVGGKTSKDDAPRKTAFGLWLLATIAATVLTLGVYPIVQAIRALRTKPLEQSSVAANAEIPKEVSVDDVLTTYHGKFSRFNRFRARYDGDLCLNSEIEDKAGKTHLMVAKLRKN